MNPANPSAERVLDRVEPIVKKQKLSGDMLCTGTDEKRVQWAGGLGRRPCGLHRHGTCVADQE